MDQVYVDRETGEDLIHSLYDCDICRSIESATVNDAETGEPEINLADHATIGCHLRRVPFQIPKEVKEKTLKKRYLELEPVPTGASFGQINPVCLFLPAIIYFRWFLALLMLLEVILHMWAHHKNKTLKNANVYFRSPFHDISAEFCALCQNETCMNRVGKMHQVRMHKFLRQCNYMKRVVT
ncbi:uncharacterized protein LOC105831841 isoform X2 [Monomorium pharaonis]|nr:uncharacterized protein LOC105831841 isoform X2 [Monomorium pharaonis]XP_036151251.1 uncharacterized protein LOC105831841 isoform X2 [Monomorium pharaonis]XP_036151252.1 uncharacterized protein LOC105831841 isoform X2 [Monomorium pharaonis]XP_036151253.1 uncharacterized protein LOC105831841 isoform X2 [Monomorium pharaonis]XP_036151254.1 uncharacterized protein LOC105831841 isoform X2 [Monomorium pharaonis]XP_036151255.1 uncharacterized protein LOC105831841 isoform X2 [Monomorium pharaonis]